MFGGLTRLFLQYCVQKNRDDELSSIKTGQICIEIGAEILGIVDNLLKLIVFKNNFRNVYSYQFVKFLNLVIDLYTYHRNMWVCY